MNVFSRTELEGIAKILGNAASKSELCNILSQTQIKFNFQESTKWRFLKDAFIRNQEEYHSWNHILNFIKEVLDPVRFVNNGSDFNHYRERLNDILHFKGLAYTENKEFKRVNQVKSLDELPKRWRTELEKRNIHYEIFKYCTSELLQDDIYHAVFEATKGLFERIRELSGVHKDGSKLIDSVFATTKPILAFNQLKTETEKSEQVGFMHLLKAACSLIRNPIAHEPRKLWAGEENALIWFSLLSLAHQMLDKCFKTGYTCED